MATRRNPNAVPHAHGIGMLSRRAGVNVETVRYYERFGLVPLPARSAGGQRRYRDEHEQRLRFIRRMRELGFSLDEVRALLRLVDGGHYTCAQVRALALTHLGAIRRKIADLRRMERTLATLAERCTGRTVPECPLIGTLSAHP